MSNARQGIDFVQPATGDTNLDDDPDGAASDGAMVGSLAIETTEHKDSEDSCP